MSMFIIQTFVMLVLACIVIYLIMYNNSLKLEKRITKYSVQSINDTSVSLFDMLFDCYENLVNNTSKKLRKSTFMKKYATRYNKYLSYDKLHHSDAMDFVTKKILIAIVFILLVFFANILDGLKFNSSSIFLAGIIGFFILDIFFVFYNYFKKKQVEQELLNAIIIMNNAFRSGRSTMQAIEIVASELTGPIKQEFKKMHMEISYGLSLDVVFERFSKRVDSDEVNYITSSLIILNKTGGNIIKVFSSIEKMLFNKRKLKQEMKSLTSSSSMISKVLLAMPFAFVVIITLINPSYFMPLITTTIGNVILGIIIAIYILYIYVVKQVMKVRFD